MKKKLMLLFLIVINLLFLPKIIFAQGAVQECFKASGNVSVTGDTSKGNITVSCPHDIGEGYPCQGNNSQSSNTDFAYLFTTCSCYPHPDQGDTGCLKINVPEGCTYQRIGNNNACGGDNSTEIKPSVDLNVDYVVECPPPPGVTPPTATPAPTPSTAPSPTPTVTPTITPTVTPKVTTRPPVGGPVVPTAPPRPTATTAPPAPTATPAPPTATPTPAFDAKQCTCDSLEIAKVNGQEIGILPGKPAEFIAYGKVNKANTALAKIESFQFLITRGFGDVEANKVARSPDVPASVTSEGVNGRDITRYKANWGYTIPADMKPGEIIKVTTQEKCVKQTGVTYNYDASRAVLGQRDQSWIVSLFQWLGFIKASPTPQPVPSPQPTPDLPGVTIPFPSQGAPNTPYYVLPGQPDNATGLQIKTINFAQTIQKDCQILRFQFK